VGIRAEDRGPLGPNDPSRLLFYGGGQNGSWHEPHHLTGLTVPADLDGRDGSVDGRVTYHGFTDHYGNVVAACSPVGTDCVPLHLTNMKVGSYQFRADVNGIATREYDVKGPDGQSPIRYPN
jgi:hypothetical protein